MDAGPGAVWPCEARFDDSRPYRGGEIASTLRPVSISTKRGDDGTTGVLHGGRVRKDSSRIEANGVIDEAQAALGLARAEVRGTKLDDELAGLERDLWVVMAEVATPPRSRSRLVAGTTLVTGEMVDVLEKRVHELEAAGTMPSEFVVPGQSRASTWRWTLPVPSYGVLSAMQSRLASATARLWCRT